MALTKSDFENYGVNEVLARQAGDDNLSAWSFWGVCGDERKRYEEAGDYTGAELFSLLTSISSMIFDNNFADPKAPFIPMWQSKEGRSFLPRDLEKPDLDFLADIAGSVTEGILRAQIEDTLWLCKRGSQFAILAVDSYLESIILGDLTYSMEQRIARALQIAKFVKNQERLDKALGIAKEIADIQSDAGETFSWSRMTGLLATYSENDRDEHAEQIWQQAVEVEGKGDLDFATRLREHSIDLFRANKDSARAKEAQLELVDTLVNYAEHEAKYGDYWIAKSLIEKAISHYKKATGNQQPSDKLHSLLFEYGKKSDENMERHKIKIEFPQEVVDELNALSESVAEEFKGKPLEDALLMLASGPHPINANKIQEEADSLYRESIAPHIASFQTINRAGKVVGRDWPFASGKLAMNHRFVRTMSIIRPAIKQIMNDHDVQLEDIVNLLERSHFVPQDCRWTFSYGLLAGLKYDLVAVAHVLPPMIENAFREILTSMGIVTSRQVKNQIEREKSLGKILDHPVMEKILGADYLFDLKTLLLAKEGGFNLRNDALHGLMVDGNFFLTEGGENNLELAQILYLWWLALRLCFIIQRTERTE